VQTLIILAHPEAAPIAEAAADELRQLGAPVRLHDLYAMRFQPAIQAIDFQCWERGEQPAELQPLQADVAWAELLILAYPTRWGGTPAMLKGYIDRVFALGFAYGVRAGKMAGFLEGKRALLFAVGDAPADERMRRVMGGATLAFCGIEIAAEASIDLARIEVVRERIRANLGGGG
jgi:NAD(P)H dehydrogenase (quinone)